MKGKHLKGYKPYTGKKRGWQFVAAVLGLLIIAATQEFEQIDLLK